MISITKIGAITIGALIVIGFGTLGAFQYQTSKQVAFIKPEVITITKTIVVTPTLAPTATSSAGIRTRVFTPASVTKGVK